MHGIRLIRELYRAREHNAEVSQGNRELHAAIDTACERDPSTRLRERLCAVLGDGCAECNGPPSYGPGDRPVGVI